MEQTHVTCPNCGSDFSVHVRATRGNCPQCSIGLVFETVKEQTELPKSYEKLEQPRQLERMSQSAQPSQASTEPTVIAISERTTRKEKVDIVRIEQMIDAMGYTDAVSKASISDIAVIESLTPDTGHASIDEKVDRLLRSHLKSKV